MGQGRDRDPLERELETVRELLGRTKRWFTHLLLDEVLEHDHLRRYYMLVDFWEAVVSGMIADDLINEGFGKANGEDLRAWLRRHGADERTLEHAPFLKGLYDLVFAYRDGDKDHPDLAAGKALQAMIRIVAGYKGAILWEMQAGMGDTVFTPLYDVLDSRGVTFEFFHRVTRLGLSTDKRSVETIEVIPQVKLVKGRYNPLFTVKRLRSWPSEPDWSQLEGGAALEEQRVDFERDPNPLGREPITLRAGEDFDEVVLGIPVGALAPICADLAEASPRFEEMLDNHHTVITQGVQLWLDRSAQELGWPYVEHTITSAYVNHLDTYSNMSHLIPRERWPSREQPGEIAYLCGVIADAQAPTQADADRQVAANALRFLQEDIGPLWPDAVDRESGAFDWAHLVDPSGGEGAQRLDAQFFRANWQPHERYVTTPAGSVKHRLRADESGFGNLKLAGDWTRNGLDGGSVEAAVTSGMQAARAISGWPAHIPGESGWLVDD
jgi:uncharacterized protein with NAD-binding domain and iron-sulfur cluster